MGGPWQISGVARPYDVSVRFEGSSAFVRAGHEGYLRLNDPVLHVRELRFELEKGRLTCHDILQCQGVHFIERFVHLAAGVSVVERDDGIGVRDGDEEWVLRWNDGAEVEIVDGWVSSGYGRRESAAVVVLRSDIAGNTILSFDFGEYVADP